jgi:C1A family cysteine protease
MPVPASIQGAEAAQTGEIHYLGKDEPIDGGHAMCAVGYDDGRRIGDEAGAFIVRNSWGMDWGANGYGFVPYRYWLDLLADDCHTVRLVQVQP